MSRIRWQLPCLWLLLSACGSSLVLAQDVRYELGHRVREFELAWDRQPSLDERLKTTPLLKQAVTAFFSMRMTEAARLLDTGTFQLEGRGEPSEALRWTRSLAVTLDRRLLDPGVDPLGFAVRTLYEVPAVAMPLAEVEALVAAREGGQEPLAGCESQKQPLTAVPLAGELRLPADAEGDYWFVGRIASGPEASTTAQRIGLAHDLAARLARLNAFVDALPARGRSLEQETVVHLTRLLSSLAQGKTPETDYPAARLLTEAEALVAASEPYYNAQRAGQFWMAVPTERGTQYCRWMVPPEATGGSPRPLVVALHGAGGSENMFFDAYGHGAIVEQCARRGWYLVAPRSAGMGLSPAPLIVAALAERFAIDPQRVFLVGHSMGAAQASISACQATGTYAAVAALGGGGTITKDAQLADLPFFVGIGTEDFAYSRAKQLFAGLQQAGARKAELHEYPQVEHLAIVQVALPDVFALFDRVAAE
ncbi:MAG: alpha/beta fold hydrolase [Pirellulales bacterium]|nr:alpha/beta fold hydrolase [Pirellulales bacterium]